LKPNRSGDPSTLITSINEAKKGLKWKPKYSLNQMIESDYLFRKRIKDYH
jgi:UDP-glucose 4-epimerase